MELSADEKTRLLYKAREKERMDHESCVDWAWTEGEKAGEKAERGKWQDVVAEKDSRIAELEAQLLKYQNNNTKEGRRSGTRVQSLRQHFCN
ncbi:MAG: hypothetical protein FWG14_08240 [Peptococcaceae bacterium]|nr:hypothetical protein [Peptococcaceae bacterium]